MSPASRLTFRKIARFFRTSAFRLVLSYMALFGLSVIALLGFIYVSTTQTIQSKIDSSIDSEIASLVAEHKNQGVERLKAAIGERMEWARVEGWVYLLTDNSFQKQAGNLRAWPSRSVKTGKGLDFSLEPMINGRNQSDENQRIMARAMSVSLPGGQVLLVGRDMREMQNFSRTMGQALLWAITITLIMGIGGGFVMSRTLLHRIDLINRGAERIMKGGINHRMPLLGTGDEFDRLTETLNAMLSNIERLMQSIQGVTTNLAHDLRSPLTRMKSKMELALLSDNKDDRHHDALEYAITESDHLLATFNALLSIADAEGGKARQNMAPVDLFALTVDAAELYAPVAEEKDLTLTMAESVGVTVTGHRQLLFQALSNLIDNAIKYTPAGGHISVSVRINNNVPELVVSDTGPGIPQAERGRVLERFVRLDESRSTAGNGLGLSLVSAIAHLHNADLVLSGDPNGQHSGLIVIFRFPAPAGIVSKNNLTTA